jgi:hypothetical protein
VVKSEFVPTWEQLNTQQLAAGTVSVFASSIYAVRESGRWMPENEEKTIILTIAQWEAHGNKTRIHRTKSLAKLKITPTNAHKIPIILQMIQDGKVPLKLSEVSA